jgi:hypothetical protein
MRSPTRTANAHPKGLLRSARPSEEVLVLPSASCSPKISVKLLCRNFSGFAQCLRNPTYFVSYRGSEAKHVVFCLRQKYNMLCYTPYPKGQKAEQCLFWQAEVCRLRSKLGFCKTVQSKAVLKLG